MKDIITFFTMKGKGAFEKSYPYSFCMRSVVWCLLFNFEIRRFHMWQNSFFWLTMSYVSNCNFREIKKKIRLFLKRKKSQSQFSSMSSLMEREKKNVRYVLYSWISVHTFSLDGQLFEPKLILYN